MRHVLNVEQKSKNTIPGTENQSVEAFFEDTNSGFFRSCKLLVTSYSLMSKSTLRFGALFLAESTACITRR